MGLVEEPLRDSVFNKEWGSGSGESIMACRWQLPRLRSKFTRRSSNHGEVSVSNYDDHSVTGQKFLQYLKTRDRLTPTSILESCSAEIISS